MFLKGTLTASQVFYFCFFVFRLFLLCTVVVHSLVAVVEILPAQNNDSGRAGNLITPYTEKVMVLGLGK